MNVKSRYYGKCMQKYAICFKWIISYFYSDGVYDYKIRLIGNLIWYSIIWTLERAIDDPIASPPPTHKYVFVCIHVHTVCKLFNFYKRHNVSLK